MSCKLQVYCWSLYSGMAYRNAHTGSGAGLRGIRAVPVKLLLPGWGMRAAGNAIANAYGNTTAGLRNLWSVSDKLPLCK